MKKKAVLLMAVIFMAGTMIAADKSPDRAPSKPKTSQDKKPAFDKFEDRVSYAIGLDIGATFRRQSMDINPDILIKAIKDVLGDKPPLMDENEIRETMMKFQTDMQKKMQEKGQKEGEDFLAKNKKSKDIVTLPDGLQYKVLNKGTGKKPKLTDTVRVNYLGKFLNGQEFDSSYKRGKPAVFPLTGVIPGWTEVLQLMPVGSKWEVYIPSNLAYGERGQAPNIPPNSTLIFTIELLAIEDAPVSE